MSQCDAFLSFFNEEISKILHFSANPNPLEAFYQYFPKHAVKTGCRFRSLMSIIGKEKLAVTAWGRH